jgi:hypothetical protein
MAEETTKAGQRFCAVDLKGDWFGLKSSANGKSAGLPVVVFGGEHADVPLEPGAGGFVGETVAKLEQSCILDFELFSKGKQIRFLADFFEALYHHNREPLLLLLDEAQRYAPQKPGPDEARTLGAVQDLVKLGRKHGIGPVLFTQRGAGLNKEVSELCDLLVAFRTPGPIDQERVKDWLDANKTRGERDQIMGQLSGLPTGTAVFASSHPELKVFGVYPVRMPETFDSSATPKVGQRRVEPKKLAAPDLEGLKTKMAEAIARAKADDPKALRARIAELERERAKAPPPPAPATPARVVIKEVPVLPKAQAEHLAAATKAVERAADQLAKATAALMEIRQFAQGQQQKVREATRAQLETRASAKPPRALPEREPGGNALPAGEAKVLTAIAQHVTGVTREQVSILTGFKRSTRDAYIQRLRSAGRVEGGSDALTATGAGLAALPPDFAPLPTGEALLSYWLQQLPSGESAILNVLAQHYPQSVSREQLSESTGFKRSTRDAYIQRLGARKLCSISSHGVTASEVLFQ